MAPESSREPPIVALLLLLSFTTGLVDAVSVLGLGKVFTANMTGNIVFMGFALAQAPGFHVPPYIVALSAFLLGALISGWVGRGYNAKPLNHWLLISSLVEASLMCGAAVVASRYDVAAQTPKMHLYAIIALTAIAMGYRNGTVRQLKIPDLTTTVLTLTVTGIASDSSLAGGTNPNLGRRLGSIVAILAGAACGAWLVLQGSLVLPLALTGLIIFFGTAIFVWAASPLQRPN